MLCEQASNEPRGPRDVDDYGDSYTAPVSEDELVEILDKMTLDRQGRALAQVQAPASTTPGRLFTCLRDGQGVAPAPGGTCWPRPWSRGRWRRSTWPIPASSTTPRVDSWPTSGAKAARHGGQVGPREDYSPLRSGLVTPDPDAGRLRIQSGCGCAAVAPRRRYRRG
jgi:hypothetical protein